MRALAAYVGSSPRRVKRLVNIMKSTPTAPGFNEVLVAGDPEWRMEALRRLKGIPVPSGNWDMMLAAAAKVGVTALQVK